MKFKKYIKYITGTTLITLFFTACSDILNEEPRSKFTPDFFTTEKGVEGGINGLYATLRRVYGQPYYYNACETGTDEYTYGSQADNNFRMADHTDGLIADPANSRWDVLWNVAYSAINSSNAIITNAEAVGISPALVAEAYFFRAFYYFQLVQTFGGVPLDLGSGKLEFNVTPSRVSTRNTVPEVYVEAIFPDLLKAVNDLPEKAEHLRLEGTVTKNTARLILAKAYLTYGWWLENERDIPTYPSCDRTDPDGHDYKWYFQQAYDVATTGIDNPGIYGLQPTFYDVNVATNDRNNEIMLYADHNETDAKYNEGNVTGWDGSPAADGGGQNQAVWMVTWYFHVVTSSLDSVTGFRNANDPKAPDREILNTATSFTRTVQAGQSFSRMWSRMATPVNLFEPGGTFDFDKTVDSRFDGTFVTTYRGTWHLSGTGNRPLYNYNDNASFLTINPQEPVVSFLDTDPGGITYFPIPNTNPNYFTLNAAEEKVVNTTVDFSGIGLGVLPGRADYVVPLTAISRTVFPGLWKLGAARNGTDYNDDKIASTRPFNILKFSEFYFIAAEAAVKGATGSRSARELINVIRERAGKWKFSVADNTAKTDDHSADMVAATPGTIDINYILDERSREYFGEGYRWHDLARTRKWEEYAGTYKIYSTHGKASSLQNKTRDIQKWHYLRPIPTSQLDFMEGDEAYKTTYQNPGY
ncbi:MAG: RagB/SusD family nutrient uptake outer membrane protein [Prevotellaceae bacterium]|jgi:hypothetical protein|nr:RagB/SusD family nutrient uptake outer membrane protein [Prevotellaceae bacterium]